MAWQGTEFVLFKGNYGLLLLFISQEFSGRDYDLEDDHMDTLPSENTSEVEDDEVGDLGEPANYKTAMLDPDKVI
ncbi:hypothetical protein Tco_1373351, partial [Tanacetum coccineum]